MNKITYGKPKATPTLESLGKAKVLSTKTGYSGKSAIDMKANQGAYLNKLANGGGGKATWAKAELKKMGGTVVKPTLKTKKGTK